MENPAMALMTELAEANADPQAVNLGGAVPYPVPGLCDWYESQIHEHPPGHLVEALGQYAPPAGPEPLREPLARHLHASGHGPVHPDNAVVVSRA